MCSLSKEQSTISREVSQSSFFFFLELCPLIDLDFLSTIKHPTADRWHPHPGNEHLHVNPVIPRTMEMSPHFLQLY